MGRAESQRWHRLAGIQQPRRIERRLHAMEHLQLGRAELRTHLVDLLDATPCSPVMVPRT